MIRILFERCRLDSIWFWAGCMSWIRVRFWYGLDSWGSCVYEFGPLVCLARAVRVVLCCAISGCLCKFMLYNFLVPFSVCFAGIYREGFRLRFVWKMQEFWLWIGIERKCVADEADSVWCGCVVWIDWIETIFGLGQTWIWTKIKLKKRRLNNNNDKRVLKV